MNSKPIVIVEDDEDDRALIEDVLKELDLSYPTVFFQRSIEALDYLKSHDNQPFIIFCDINLPEMSGLDFKRKIDGDKVLRQKSIPFIYFSTSADKGCITEAYNELTVQGYFQKANTYDETKKIVRLILEYWEVCKHPNS